MQLILRTSSVAGSVLSDGNTPVKTQARFCPHVTHRERETGYTVVGESRVLLKSPNQGYLTQPWNAKKTSSEELASNLGPREKEE